MCPWEYIYVRICAVDFSRSFCATPHKALDDLSGRGLFSPVFFLLFFYLWLIFFLVHLQIFLYYIVEISNISINKKLIVFFVSGGLVVFVVVVAYFCKIWIGLFFFLVFDIALAFLYSAVEIPVYGLVAFCHAITCQVVQTWLARHVFTSCPYLVAGQCPTAFPSAIMLESTDIKDLPCFFFCVFFPLSFYSATLPSFRSYLVYRPALYAARCAQIRSWDDQIYLLVIAAVGQEDGIDQPRIRNWPFSCMTDCRQAPLVEACEDVRICIVLERKRRRLLLLSYYNCYY